MAEMITSAGNPRVKRIRELASKSRARRKEGRFVIEGERIFADTPAEYLDEVFVTQAFAEKCGGDAAKRLRQIPFTVVTDQVMEKMADTKTPQGVLCTARIPACKEQDLMGAGTPLLLILENIRDPGNLGTMFRTAEAAGVSGIIMSAGTADLFSPKTVRSTMSAVFRMPFQYTDDLPGTLRSLAESGIRLYATHLGGERNYDEVRYGMPCGLLIGNEANGLTQEAAELAQEKILIPMQGKIESLNAAMAAGIVLFEAARQRRLGCVPK